MKTQTFLVLLGSLAFFLCLSGCGNGNPSDLSTPVIPTNTQVAHSPTDTPVEPTEVEQAQPGTLVLLTTAQDGGEYQSIVEQVTAEYGLVLDVREEMAVADVPPNLSLVVMMGAPQNIEELTTTFPEVKFLGIGGDNWPGTANMFVFGESNGNSPTQAFLAGYIAAVQSEEYRIGIVSVNDVAGQVYRKAFLNGVIYFCGTCTPVFPPYEVYPLFVEVPAGADQTTLENAVSTLIASGVNIIHIAPPLQNEAIYMHLMMIDARSIGTVPPPAGLEGIWVGSVISNPGIGLENTLNALLKGQSLPDSPSTLEITYIGASEARLAHFYEILEKLESGEIDPVGP